MKGINGKLGQGWGSVDTFCGSSQAVELQKPVDAQLCGFSNAVHPIGRQTASACDKREAFMKSSSF